MNKFTHLLIFVLIAGFTLQSCDLLDGTEAETNQLTLDQTTVLPNTAGPFVAGLEEQLGSSLNAYISTAELATDNYINTQTFFNQNVDEGIYINTDNNFSATQTQFAVLRQNANFGLREIVGDDGDAAGTALEAEMLFFRGYGNLVLGEATTAFPADSLGEPAAPAVLFNRAISDFQDAIEIAPNNISYRIVLARTYYNLGDQDNAVKAAQSAIDAAESNPTFSRLVLYDGTNGPTNTMQDALFDRGSFDDLQPLPRLDFLDPKYANDGDTETSIPIAKIEEAHLILAEANLADGNVAGAQQNMRDAISVVNTRNDAADDGLPGLSSQTDPLRSLLDDSGDPRVILTGVLGFEEIPDNAGIIRYPGAAVEFGLVLNRDEELVTIPTISGTSVTEGDINSLSRDSDGSDGDDSGNGFFDNPADNALALVYLLRQEIFIAEGRRMVDLGIRWPLVEDEFFNNNFVNEGDAALQPVIPDYLQPIEEVAVALDLSLSVTDDGNILHTISFNNSIVEALGNQFDN